MKACLLQCASLFSILALAGCDSYQQEFAAIGATVCGAAGAAIRTHTAAQRALDSSLAAGGCGLAGSMIGAALDARDRERQELAEQRVLSAPMPPQYEQLAYNTPVAVPVGSGYATAARRTRPVSEPAAPTQTDAAASSAASDAAPAAPAPGLLPGLPKAPQAQWVSDHSGASGTVKVASIDPPTASGGACKTLSSTTDIPGQSPTTEQAKFCESAPGANDWAKI